MPLWRGWLVGRVRSIDLHTLRRVASGASISHQTRSTERDEMGTDLPGSARLQLAAGVPLLRPEEQVFEAMLTGWRNQQLARNLAFSTIEGRENAVKAFTRHADALPWQWMP